MLQVDTRAGGGRGGGGGVGERRSSTCSLKRVQNQRNSYKQATTEPKNNSIRVNDVTTKTGYQYRLVSNLPLGAVFSIAKMWYFFKNVVVNSE